MKKWFLILIATFLIASCSFNRAWKWIEDVDWERDDQTIRIVDIFFK
ncbi:MAG: hypothetical protein WC647_18620 [Desulfomonilaceae bacterium]